MTANDVLSRLAARVPSLRGARGSIGLEIEGQGTWLIVVRDGDVSVERPGREQAACALSTDEATFVELATGRRNPVTSLMQGRVRFHGDVQNLVLFQRVLQASEPALARASAEERP